MIVRLVDFVLLYSLYLEKEFSIFYYIVSFLLEILDIIVYFFYFYRIIVKYYGY